MSFISYHDRFITYNLFNMSRPPFAVAGAVAVSTTSVRVSFSRYPLTADRNGRNDALNSSNYLLLGPGNPKVVRVEVVLDHPEEVLLRTDQTVAAGRWTVRVGDVRTAQGAVLEGTTAAFEVGTTFDSRPGDEVFRSIERDFHPSFRHGRNWRALLTALTTGDLANREFARAAFDQMFASTATGRYLDDHGARSHVERPIELGMDDETYRKLIVALDSRRVVPDLIREVLDLFYGVSATRPVLSSVAGPFSFREGQDLSFEGPEGTIRLVVQDTDFTDLDSVSGEEVVAWMNRWFTDFRSPLRCSSVAVEGSSERGVEVVGPRGTWLSVPGGTAQSSLRLPSELSVYDGGSLPAWTVSEDPSSGRIRFTTTSTHYDLSGVRVGDYVVVTGSEFAEANRGTHRIVRVRRTISGGTTTQYFEARGSGSAQVVTQGTVASVRFFRPNRVRPSREGLARADGSLLLPALTTAVRRDLASGQYLGQNPPVAVSSVLRSVDGSVTVESVAHGLSVGDRVEVVGIRPVSVAPETTAGDVVGPPLLTSARPVTHWSVLKAPGRALVDHTVTSVGDVALVVGGYDGTNHASDCSLFEITSEDEPAPDARRFEYTWDSAAAIPVARSRHRSLAPQHPQLRGAVFVCGGYDGGELDDCYRYDFGTDAWTALDSLTTGRYWHEAVELADGKILVAGGFDGGGTPTADVEIYDPATDTWSSGAPMNVPRAKFAAALDSRGMVVVVGGLTTTTDPTPTSEVYDPDTDTWSTIGNSSLARYGCRAVSHESRIFVGGGNGFVPRDGSGTAARREVEVLTDLDTWVPANDLPEARGALGGASLNRLFWWGGGAVGVDRTEGSGWIRSFATLTAYDRSASCVLESGVVLDVGGVASGTPQDRAALLVPASDSWTGGSMNQVFTITGVQTNSFVLGGGGGYSDFEEGIFRRVDASAASEGSRYVPVVESRTTTNTSSTLSEALDADVTTNRIVLASGTSFPETGWVVLDLGTTRQVLTEYRSKVGDALQLASPLRVESYLGVGTEVRLLLPEEMDLAAKDAVVTASASGLKMLQDVLDDVEAAGDELVRLVEYPGDRGFGGEGRDDGWVWRQ